MRGCSRPGSLRGSFELKELEWLWGCFGGIVLENGIMVMVPDEELMIIGREMNAGLLLDDKMRILETYSDRWLGLGLELKIETWRGA